TPAPADPDRDTGQASTRHLGGGVVPLSARSEQALRELAGAFADRLDAGADPHRLTAAAWTRRAHHPFRLAVPFGDTLLTDLLALAAGEGRLTRTVAAPETGIVFVY